MWVLQRGSHVEPPKARTCVYIQDFETSPARQNATMITTTTTTTTL